MKIIYTTLGPIIKRFHPRTVAFLQFGSLCCFIIFGLFANVNSVPRFAAEMGMDCGSCHFAQGGGAIRNRFGHFTMSVHTLSLTSTRAKLLEGYQKPELSKGVTIGVDARWRLFDDGSLSRYQQDFYIAIEALKLTFLNFTLNANGIDESYFLYDRAY
ncbi:hypothetical protein JYT16_01865, partial [Gemmatimonas aurantiaca]|nr:hypothetical protein [Gemmatimonas aurantiaca]